jgi:hypothetical protein
MQELIGRKRNPCAVSTEVSFTVDLEEGKEFQERYYYEKGV